MLHHPRRSWARVGRTVLTTAERVLRAARRHEARRIRRHFAGTLSWLGGRDVSSLDPERRAARKEHLSALATYSLLGRFPRNVDRPDRFGPIFVDAEGRRCAMGHLIERAGGRALVERVRSTANLAYIAELAHDVDLLVWLDRAGLTVEEAARIQPSYWCTPAELCFCSGWVISTETVYEATVQSIDDGAGGGGSGGAGGASEASISVTYRIDAVHGAGAVEVGALVTSGDPGEYVSVSVGERFLLEDQFYPFYGFLDAETLDTTACAMVGGVGDLVPTTAPAAAAIANIMGDAPCGEGLPEAWSAEVYDCQPDGAGGATAASSAAATSGSSSASTATSSSASVGAGGAASSGSSASAGPGGAPGEGGGADGSTQAPGGGSGGCSCGVAGDAAGAGETAFVLAAVIGSRWLRRRGPSRARGSSPDRARSQQRHR
jgi:MYXO-CTERM domain-containing protein